MYNRRERRAKAPESSGVDQPAGSTTLADFTGQNIMIWVAIGGLFGWIADAAFKATRIGTMGNIVVGIVGAFAATWLSVHYNVYVNIANDRVINMLLTSFLGAIVLLAAVAIFDRSTD